MCKFSKTWGPMQLLVCLMLVALSPLARASILSNGQTGPPSLLDPGGTELAFTHGTITTPTFTTLYSVAVWSDPGNTFCSGCLDFTYRFTNNGPDINERFTAFNFGSYMVDAGYAPSTSGVIPLTVNRSTTGAVIGFNYMGSDLMPGQSTVMLVVETNATKWTSGFVSVQDGTAGWGLAFQPTSATPVSEPTSLILLGGSLLGLAAVIRLKLSL